MMYKTLIAFFLGMVWVLFNIQYTLGFDSSAIAGFVFILSVLGSIVLITIGAVYRNMNTFFIGLLIVIMGFGGFFLASKINAAKEEQSKEIAMHIISAIEKYHEDNLKYPDKLADLVPTNLPTLPKTKMRLYNHPDFYYSYNSDKDYYVIGFNTQPWMLCEYNSLSKTWEVND